MKIYLVILFITLAVSQRYYFPGEIGVYGPAKDSSSQYRDCFVSRSSSTPTQPGSRSFIPNPLMYASAYDPTLFPLMSRYFKDAYFGSYLLVGAFKFSSSTATLNRYNLYYVTDKGLINCDVTSYPKMMNGFISAGCNYVD